MRVSEMKRLLNMFLDAKQHEKDILELLLEEYGTYDHYNALSGALEFSGDSVMYDLIKRIAIYFNGETFEEVNFENLMFDIERNEPIGYK